jgi:cleavage and polyadenylation specificity factor subunit 3
MTRLKSKLLSFNAQKAVPTKIYSPANCEELRIPFKTDKIAKVVGKLASIAPPLPRSLTPNGDESISAAEDQEGEKVDMISGVLVQNDFKISLMAPEDLKEYAGLTTTTILCRQHLTLSAAGVDLIRWALEGTFGAIKESSLTDAAVDGKMNGNGTTHDGEADEEVSRTETKFTVMDCVNVLIKNGGRVEVEWEGNVINDGIADAVLAVLFTVESSPAAVRRKSHPPIQPSTPTRLHTNTHHLESSKQHSHNHASPPKEEEEDEILTTKLTHRFKKPHPHRTTDPSTRLARLFLFLEAQFGEEAVRPITLPRNSTTTATANGTPAANPDSMDTSTPDDAKSQEPFSVAALPPPIAPDDQLSAEDKAELKRLHNLGIPVPGVEIKFDKWVAKVWLEDLDVECANNALRARVKAVVERGVETVSGLWR